MELPIILVVEDEQDIQALIEDTLSDAGFDSAVVAFGEEAVTLLKGNNGKYRALVTDINLKGKMDGWEAAQHAREIEPDFPVVYMSGASAAEWTSKGVPGPAYRCGLQPPQQDHSQLAAWVLAEIKGAGCSMHRP